MQQNKDVITSSGVSGEAGAALAEDMLQGADAIASFLGWTRRQVYHRRELLPIFQVGSILQARRSTLLRWIAEQETQAQAKRA